MIHSGEQAVNQDYFIDIWVEREGSGMGTIKSTNQSSLPIYELKAELCRALGNPVRLELVHFLREGPQRVSDLAEAVNSNQGTVSRHLAVLRNSGILTASHQGRDIYYQIVDPRISDLCDLMRQVLLEQASKRSRMLKTFDEELE